MISVFFFLITAFVTYSLTVHRTNDWVAPCGILSLIWFLAAALADVPQLKHDNLQSPWILETYVAIYFSGLTVFSIGYILQKKTKSIQIQIETSNNYQRSINLLIVLSILAVALRIYLFGFSLDDTISSVGGLDLKDERSQAIPFVHYFEILTPFLTLCAIFEINISKNLSKKRRLMLISYIVYSTIFYCLILSASRGSLLVVICGTLYLYVRQEKIKGIKLLIYSATILSALSLLSFVRMSEETLTNSFLGDEGFSLFISPIYTYIAFNFDNLNKLVASDLSPSYIFYSLKFLLWPVLKSEYESGLIWLVDFDTLFFNARTWIYAFYHDLGLFGCFLYPAIIATILSFLHNKSNANPKYILPMMALQKPIIFAFFGNYFFGELILIIPLIILLILSFLLKQKYGIKYAPQEQNNN